LVGLPGRGGPRLGRARVVVAAWVQPDNRLQPDVGIGDLLSTRRELCATGVVGKHPQGSWSACPQRRLDRLQRRRAVSEEESTRPHGPATPDEATGIEPSPASPIAARWSRARRSRQSWRPSPRHPQRSYYDQAADQANQAAYHQHIPADFTRPRAPSCSARWSAGFFCQLWLPRDHLSGVRPSPQDAPGVGPGGGLPWTP
jgi:hypothetical protein